jgi:hypothetical protein
LSGRFSVPSDIPAFTISSSASLNAKSPSDWLIATPRAYRVFCSSVESSAEAAGAAENAMQSKADSQLRRLFMGILSAKKVVMVPQFRCTPGAST